MEKPNKNMPNSSIYFEHNFYEKAHWKRGMVVCGIDEAGRGPLAGPVVAAAVIIPIDTHYFLLKDSKVLTEQERLCAFEWIQNKSLFGIGIVRAEEIDRLNIWRATLKAMRRAVMQLVCCTSIQPKAFLVDAMPLSLQGTMYQDTPVYSFLFGEKRSSSIAAASIVAKVVRDSIMQQIDVLFPSYAFGQHKGYGTVLHKKRIAIYHPSLIHRKSYKPIKGVNQHGDEKKQQRIC